jgi:protease I
MTGDARKLPGNGHRFCSPALNDAELMEKRVWLSHSRAARSQFSQWMVSNRPSWTSQNARSPKQGFNYVDKGDAVNVDATFDKANADDYDGVVLPGGVVNGDAIRLLPQAQAFIKAANNAHKPIAVICHGTWLPVSAGIIKGRTVTSWPSLQDDIRNAGGTWVDQEVVEDDNLISSRKPDDLPAFNKTLIAQLGRHKAA